ncbi:MAG: hypothetical protein V1781_07415 [Bacteroidota bacterium]
MDSILIKQFGKQELAVLRTEIQSALDNIKTKYGMSELTLCSIHFTASDFTSKITAKLQNSETKNSKQNETNFFALRHGLPTNFIGCEFVLDNDIFTITQLAISRPKYPITAHCKENGKTFKFTVSRIKELLEKNRVINIT